jgi:hypothetical protein
MERLHARQANRWGPFLHCKAELACPVRDHRAAAGNLMRKRTEVEEGSDLSGGELIRETRVR